MRSRLEAAVDELEGFVEAELARPADEWLRAERERATAACCAVCGGDASSLALALARGAAHATVLAHSSAPAGLAGDSPPTTADHQPPSIYWAEAARGQDAKLLARAERLRRAPAVGIPSDLAALSSAHSYAVAEQLLGGLRTAPTPQGRLRAVLRAWDAVRAPSHHALGRVRP